MITFIIGSTISLSSRPYDTVSEEARREPGIVGPEPTTLAAAAIRQRQRAQRQRGPSASASASIVAAEAEAESEPLSVEI